MSTWKNVHLDEIQIKTTSIVKSHHNESDFHKEIKKIYWWVYCETESLYALEGSRNYYSQLENQYPSSS